jgi:hypothetical protein
VLDAINEAVAAAERVIDVIGEGRPVFFDRRSLRDLSPRVCVPVRISPWRE